MWIVWAANNTAKVSCKTYFHVDWRRKSEETYEKFWVEPFVKHNIACCKKQTKKTMMVEMFPYLSWKIHSSGNTSFVMSERAQQFFHASDHTQYQVLALLYEDDLFFSNMLKVQRSISFFHRKGQTEGWFSVCLFVCLLNARFFRRCGQVFWSSRCCSTGLWKKK